MREALVSSRLHISQWQPLASSPPGLRKGWTLGSSQPFLATAPSGRRRWDPQGLFWSQILTLERWHSLTASSWYLRPGEDEDRELTGESKMTNLEEDWLSAIWALDWHLRNRVAVLYFPRKWEVCWVLLLYSLKTDLIVWYWAVIWSSSWLQQSSFPPSLLLLPPL